MVKMLNIIHDKRQHVGIVTCEYVSMRMLAFSPELCISTA